MKDRTDGFRASDYIVFSLITLAAIVLCICVGSVTLPTQMHSRIAASVIAEKIR